MTSREIQAEPAAKADRSDTPLKEEPTRDLIPPGAFKLATSLLLLYFGARLLYFALSVSSFVPPDEVTHAGLAKVFARALILPDNAPETYQFGLVTNVPWLYYWGMGKLLHLNFLGLPDLVFLRLLNIALAFGTIRYALRLLRLLTCDRLTGILFLAVVTNLAMFSLLSASVSYDNLTNLLAAMSLYHLFAFFRQERGDELALSLLCQMAGCLTKVTFLPLALALEAILLTHLMLHKGRRLDHLGGRITLYFRQATPRRWALLALALAALLLNLQLYGGNYLKYHALLPTMSAVLSPEAALQYRMDARGMIFSQFKEGKISYMDAVMMAGNINHPGDKADTFYLLMNWRRMQDNPQLWMGPLDYLGFWTRTMLGTIVGIKGHLSMLKPPVHLIPFYLVTAAALLGCALRWRPRDGWMAPALAAVALFYAGFLLYRINYDSYLNYGEAGITVYGRYLFPILVPVCVVGCSYLLRLFRDETSRVAVALCTALLFICYDFPWFLTHSTPQWFSWLPQ